MYRVVRNQQFITNVKSTTCIYWKYYPRKMVKMACGGSHVAWRATDETKTSG